MAKCGHDVCPDDNCGWKHALSRTRRNNCRRVQRCFEEYCSSLKAFGPSGFLLYDVCLGHCHRAEDNPKYPAAYPTTDAYLCDNFDPVALVDYFGVNVCGVPGDQTNVGQIQTAAAQSGARTRQVLLFIAGVILVLLAVLLWKNKGK